jgi:hypothetical protein
MHGEELVEGLGTDDRRVRHRQLQPHHQRLDAADEEEDEG